MIRFIVCCAVFFLAIEGRASAAPVHFALSGTVHVNFHRGPLPLGIFEGAPWTALLSYDTDITDTWPEGADDHRGYYLSTDRIALRIDMGPTYFLPASNTYFLAVGNDIDWPDGQPPPTPKFGFRGDSILFTTGEFETTFPYQFGSINLNFVDPTSTALTSDALPLELSAGWFQLPTIDISHGSLDPREDSFSITASVDRIEVVPEPHSRLLLITAIALFLFVFLARSHSTLSSRRIRKCCVSS